jgi:cyclic pyranopterin phosphate synthase
MTQNSKPNIVYWLDNTLYLNITNQCSSCCYFCFKRYKRGVGGFNLKLTKEPNLEDIKKELSGLLNSRCWDGIVFCGFGEPTERLDILIEVTRWLREYSKRHLPIRLDTNGHGYLLNPGRDVVFELKTAGLDKINVSLNAGDKETYFEVCKPIFPDAYESMLDFIQKAKTVFDVEATAVRLPEIDMAKVEALAKKLGVKFRIRDYVPCFF